MNIHRVGVLDKRALPALKEIKMRLLGLLTVSILAIGATPSLAAIYDKPYVGENKQYRTDYEDTFVKIAREYGLGYVEMRAANPDVDPWLPGDNTNIVLPLQHILPDAPREGIVINLPEMRLYYYPKDGSAPINYPIGIGREGLQTPQGTTSVVRTKEGPTWRPTPRMREEKPELPASVPPGPDNPLGSHALYLGWPQYLIHGTNKPYAIGRRVSSGCIRMYPEDIPKLYDLVKSGTKVTVVNQPVKAAWIDDVLYVEANPTVEQADIVEITGRLDQAKFSEEDIALILKAAGDVRDSLDWDLVENEVAKRSGVPFPVAVRNGAQWPDMRYSRVQGKRVFDQPQRNAAAPADITVHAADAGAPKMIIPQRKPDNVAYRSDGPRHRFYRGYNP